MEKERKPFLEIMGRVGVVLALSAVINIIGRIVEMREGLKKQAQYQKIAQRANAGDKEALQILTQSTYENLGEQLLSLQKIEESLKQAQAILQKKSHTIDDVSAVYEILNKVQVDVARYEKKWKVDLHSYVKQITQALGKLAEVIEASKKSK